MAGKLENTIIKIAFNQGVFGAEHMVIPNRFGVLIARKEETKDIRQPTCLLHTVYWQQWACSWNPPHHLPRTYLMGPTWGKFRTPPLETICLIPKRHTVLFALWHYFNCAPHWQEHTVQLSVTQSLFTVSIWFSQGWFYPLWQAAQEPNRACYLFL